MGSSTFRDCDFYLDESQVLNDFYFKFVVVSFKQCFMLSGCSFRCMCQRLKTMSC
ncbi:hypothetical protein Hanom_Chr04g00288521 [Helianthus anomalus]